MLPLVIDPSVQSALNAGKPIVALESALITHGFNYPANLNITLQMIDVIRDAGVLAAVIGVYHGQPTVGLHHDQIAELAADPHADKVSLRDIPLSHVRGGHGGTTVAATAWLACQAGVRVFATGGIGGVHRGHPEDISADLPVLSSTPIMVVCAGAKSILDLPRTLEYLETAGVPVLGWRTDDFPAFYSRSSGLPVDFRVHNEREVLEIFSAQRDTGLSQGLLIVVPVPQEAEIPNEDIEPLIQQAILDAEEDKIFGKFLTPYMLERMNLITDSRTQFANESLLINNARVASQIARAMV
jgi:pseudouridine-5'-phosphate glycosidase